MEAIANVNVQAAQPTLRQSLMANAAEVSGDPFAAIFQQLMGSVEGEEDTLAAMLQLLAADVQQDAEDMGTKLAAEMLFTMPGIQPDALLAMLANNDLTVQNPQLTAALQAMLPNAELPDAAAVARAVRQTLELQQPAAEAVQEGEEGEKTADTDTQAFDVLLAREGDSEQPAAPQTGLQLDYAALRAARQLLEKDRQNTPAAALDIESLQQAVNSNRYLRAEAMPAQAAPVVPDGEEIAAQVKTGILNNVAGKSEFVVRLKPDGIGEIVVRLSEDKDKISLSILTTSTQTARLLNNEVAALQNALRPLQAEVQEITVVTGSEQAAQYSAQNQMTDQGRQPAYQQENRGQQNSRAFAGEEPDSFAQAVQPAAEDGLDTYV